MPPVPQRLRPGLVVARHDDHHLQVGLDAPHRVLLTDSPDVRRLLAALQAGDPLLPDSLPALHARQRLESAGLLVDAELATTAPVAAMQHGPRARPVLARRAAVRVHIDAPAELRSALAAVLHTAGMTVSGAGDVAVVGDLRPPRRARVDPLVQGGVPHLVVHGDLDGWVVGPFVVPGASPCLRCVDAALVEESPRRGVVLEQVATAGPPPVDPLQQALALAWAARDLQAWADGERPATWGTTVRFGVAAEPAMRRWPRHPYCGCGWDLVLCE